MLHLFKGISKANSVLLQEKEIDQSLQKLVEALGKATSVDRCYIFTNREENAEVKLYYTQEWCNTGIEAQLGNPDLNGISYNLFPGLYQALIDNQAVSGLVKNSTNQHFKEIMESQSIKAYLFTPIFCETEFWGWMGYDDCTHERNWQPEEIEALHTVAKNIGLRLLRERSELNFKNAKDRFNLNLLASQQAMWEWDITANKLNYSKKFMEMLGYEHFEFPHTYQNWSSRLHIDDLPEVQRKIQAYLDGESHSYVSEFRMLHKNGQYIWLRGSGAAQRDENGKAIFIAGSNLDITKLKEQQNDLTQQRNEFDFLLNNLAEVVFRINTNMEFTFLNDFWERISGFNKAKSLQQSFSKFIFIDDIIKLLEKLNSLNNGYAKSVNFNVRLKKKDDKIRWVNIIANKLTNVGSDQSFIAGSIIDINDRIEAEQHEKELLAMKSDFVAMASHQFKTPLTVIHANVELMEIYAEQTEPKTSKKFNTLAVRIKSEIDRMTDLMNNILLFGKYNTNELPLNLKPVVLSRVVKNVIDAYFNNLPNGRALEFNNTKTKMKVLLDELTFTYVLTNILSNALKYSEGRPNPEIQINYHEKNCEVVVSDYGIGIPEADQSKLFTSFYRASNTQTTPGSGLGLVVAKQFIELHGGSIKITSKINVGTEVKLILPYANE